jgi:Ca-activated chloride channel homolog
MKLGTVIIGSLLGMGGTSVGVSWMVDARGPGAGTSAPTARPDGPADVARPDAAESSEGLTLPSSPETSFAHSGTLRFEGRMGHTALPADRSEETFLLYELGADETAEAASRAPVNVSIVIDRSGSMRGQRLQNAIAAAQGMFDRLRADDVVSVVAYADRAEVLVPRTTVGRMSRGEFGAVLSDLRGGGNTCISCGVEVARSLLRQSDGVRRILLLSDGQANRGAMGVGEFRALGDAVRIDGSALASIGVDVDYDERTLFALSEASDGRHYFVADPRGLPVVIEQEAQALLGVLADRVDLEVTLAEGVRLLEVVDRAHTRVRDRVRVDLGQIGRGESKTVLLRVAVDAGRGDRSIAQARVTYRDLVAERDESAEGRLAVLQDPSLSRRPDVDAAVEARLGRKDTLEALISANDAFRRGDTAAAGRALEKARTTISSRKRRAAVAGTPKVDADFDRQLQALGSASEEFQKAIDAPPSSVPFPQSAPAKAATRFNQASASPFSD